VNVVDQDELAASLVFFVIPEIESTIALLKKSYPAPALAIAA
jgi:hypothetical protein